MTRPGVAIGRSVLVSLRAAVLVAVLSGTVAGVAGVAASPSGAATARTAAQQAKALNVALKMLVRRPGGPPGVIVVVQRNRSVQVFRAGTAVLASTSARAVPIQPTDHIRLASVAKAFSGAAALSLVADGTLSLRDTIGKWLPAQPAAWHAVTLAELLQHTSGLPDFSKSPAFAAALAKAPASAPPPATLLSYVATQPLAFPPGSSYHYSNSDNVAVGLMIEAASHQPYATELQTRVYAPLGLVATSLPSGSVMPNPYVRGYAETDDVTGAFAAGWSWASGGIVSTPSDATTFIRGYARGATTNVATARAQFTFRPGSSEPPGPGTNSVGLAVFRYAIKGCGTVFGHTGNTPGYTNYIAATRDGTRSVVVSVNAQLTPMRNPTTFAALRGVYTLATCAALAKG